MTGPADGPAGGRAWLFRFRASIRIPRRRRLWARGEGGRSTAPRALLAGRGLPPREVELGACPLEDKPGPLAGATRKLADAGINIEACLPTGMSGSQGSVAFAMSEPAPAGE